MGKPLIQIIVCISLTMVTFLDKGATSEPFSQELCAQLLPQDCPIHCEEIVATNRCQDGDEQCLSHSIAQACEKRLKAADMALEVLECEAYFQKHRGDCVAFCDTLISSETLPCKGFSSLINCAEEYCSRTRAAAPILLERQASNLRYEADFGDWVKQAMEACNQVFASPSLYRGQCKLNCWFLAKQAGHVCDSNITTLNDFTECYNQLNKAHCSL